MSVTVNELKKLNETDVYSLMAFVLFKSRGDAELGPFSELPYLLDMDSMLNLCEYFGGQTLYIPTIEEFETVAYALTAYQLINIDGKPRDEVMGELSSKIPDFQKVKTLYEKLCEILQDYKFSTR